MPQLDVSIKTILDYHPMIRPDRHWTKKNHDCDAFSAANVYEKKKSTNFRDMVA